MRKLKFPSYEYINSLDFKSKEYYGWAHYDSITGTNSGQRVNPNTNTATSKGE